MQPVIDTTPTQYALFVCFLVVGPALAIAASYVQWQRGESVVFGAFVAAGASWFGWFVSCAAAALLFPGYPVSGHPAEPVAMLCTLPGGAITGLLALAWLASRRPVTRGTRTRLLLVVSSLVLASAAVGWTLVSFHVWLMTPDARLVLPDSAVVVSEEGFSDDFLGDFTYSLTARMTLTDFHAWMLRLGLEPLPAAPLRYERPGSEDWDCGARGWYANGAGHYSAWCS